MRLLESVDRTKSEIIYPNTHRNATFKALNSKLLEILEQTRESLTALSHKLPELREAAEGASPAPSWDGALRGPNVAVVAEVKRRSPSAGVIREDLDPASVARAYQAGGAAAVSVLTNAPYFGGSLEDLRVVADVVDVPVLRKDFILHPAQLFEARAAGASAVLLIARAMEQTCLRDMTGVARDIGLSVLVEVHDSWELDTVLRLEGVTVGVNSRDLNTFELKIERLEQVLRHIPPEFVAVAESGLSCRADLERVADWGADAVLVGTALASSEDPEAAVRDMVEVRRRGRR